MIDNCSQPHRILLKESNNLYVFRPKNKASYSYYKKTDCAKEIEECMKALLNEYIYKSNYTFYFLLLLISDLSDGGADC